MREAAAPAIFRDAIEGGGFIFVYGEPGSGKTTLANLVASILTKETGRISCYIATEAGSVGLPWAKLERVYVASLDSLIVKLVKCIMEGRPVVVDTINALYTGEPEGELALGLASSLLRVSRQPAFAAGQVRGWPPKPWGWRWITPWATHVAAIRRARSGLSVVEFFKPRRALTAIRIAPGGVSAEWA